MESDLRRASNLLITVNESGLVKTNMNSHQPTFIHSYHIAKNYLDATPFPLAHLTTPQATLYELLLTLYWSVTSSSSICKMDDLDRGVPDPLVACHGGAVILR